MEPINFEPINNGPDVTLGVSDPNHTSDLWAEGGGPFAGKDVPMNGAFKGTQTDMSGKSGMQSQQYGSNDRGIGSYEPQYNPTVSDSTSLPVAQAVDPITFGDPNGTADDFKDGAGNLDSVTLSGANNTYTKHGFDTPNN